MKIDLSILSIPPYISTSWKNISSLHVDLEQSPPALIVTLTNAKQISIPNMDPRTIEMIFACHEKHLETEQGVLSKKIPLPPKPSSNLTPAMDGFGTAFSFPLEASFTEMGDVGAVLQHNSELSDSPDLPPALTTKITSLSKSLGITDPNLIPQPEPHCNCTHCQIARALHLGLQDDDVTQIESSVEEEEIVSDDDLKFRTWDINQTGDKLFIVQNPLDTLEHYSVYLGEPIGCTCGEKHCEHIKAVLNS